MTGPVVLHVAAVEYTLRRLVLPQLRLLSESGFDVRVACAPELVEFHRSMQPFDPRVVRFPRALDARALVPAAGQLRRLVEELKPALVHFHTPAASIPGRTVLAAGMRKRPLIAQTVHGFYAQPKAGDLMGRPVAAAERFLSRYTDLSLFVSAEDLDEASHRGYRGALRYLGNGVDEEWFAPAPPAQRPPGPLRAVFVGRVVQEKGILDLLQALSMVDNVVLTVIGDQLPTDRDGVMQQARALPDALEGRVRFTGMIEAPQIREEFSRADLMVLPSHREGVPTSVIEAMAFGLPVLATAIRGCRELVETGENGWLVEPHNPGALADGLRKAANTPSEKLHEMGVASQNRALQYRRETVFDRLLKAYRELNLG